MENSRRFPGESVEYRAARDRLLEAEIGLRRQTEKVAALRRELPLGGAVATDYAFTRWDRGAPVTVRMSELFGDKDTLLLYSFMFGPEMERPCPMCTCMLDGLDGAVDHLEQRVALGVVAKSPIERVMAFAGERGWRRLPMLSSAGTTYNRDYRGEDEDGAQDSRMNVFVRRGGNIHLFWSSEMNLQPSDPGQNQRHVDLLWPLWNALDMTPEGRGTDWYPSLRYDR